MKTKLILTVDRAAVAEAKKFSGRNGTSLSESAENRFHRLSRRPTMRV